MRQRLDQRQQFVIDVGRAQRADMAQPNAAVLVDDIGLGDLNSAVEGVYLHVLVAQGEDIAPIPGTRRVARVEENTAADAVKLSASQIERLNNLSPASGERHNEANMAGIDR